VTTDVLGQSALDFPLKGRVVPGVGGRTDVWFEEYPALTHLNLRGNLDEVDFTASVTGVLGIAPPGVPNRVARTSDTCLHWLSLDEWLIVSTLAAALIEKALAVSLAGRHYALVNLSGGQTVLRIGGVRARDILASDCTLDFHPRVFRHGDCRQSLLAGAPVLIRRVDEVDEVAFDLVVRRSFSRHLFDWLTDAAHETGYILRTSHGG